MIAPQVERHGFARAGRVRGGANVALAILCFAFCFAPALSAAEQLQPTAAPSESATTPAPSPTTASPATASPMAVPQRGGSPALWMVQGRKAKAYLFGTIHVMKPSVVWLTPAIDRALTQSDDLWLEVPDDMRDPSAILPQVMSLGMDPTHPLSTKISKADVDRLDVLATSLGLPGEASLEPFRPWFAAAMVAVLPAMKAGYSAGSGIDTVLREKMNAAGKPIKGFESITDQLHFLADLPQAQEVAFLHEAIVVADAPKAETKSVGIDKIEAVWQSGDVDQAAQLLAQMNSTDPLLSATLLTNRNANWAKQLDARLQGEGTSFIAVGMLHLVGADGLVQRLAKLGYTVIRVE